MEEVPVSDNSPGRHEVAVARTEAPAMPRPSRSTLWRDTPHLIVSNGQRYGLGWIDTKKEGPASSWPASALWEPRFLIAFR